MIYAGFWRRFGALWLDFIVLLPLTGLTLWGSEHYRLFYPIYFVPGVIFGLFYSVYLVRRYGGTPGKLMAGLRIRKPDGAQIGLREAFLRYLPEALLGAIVQVGLIYAYLAISDSEYFSLGIFERQKRLETLTPAWYRAAYIVLQIWIWGEFVVMMTNRKRRALHDFIAGTVVIVNVPNEALQPTAQPLPRPDGG